MILIILASGTGNRLKSKTKRIPKCLVKVNNKPIIEYMNKFINCFSKVFIVVGYKADNLKKFLKGKKIKFVHNNNYNSTNMVHSIFCASKYINEDVVISYSDIIFDHSIFKLFKKKKTLMPIKKDWIKVWKKRMGNKNIKNDAENLVIKGNRLVTIGEKIGYTIKDRNKNAERLSKLSKFLSDQNINVVASVLSNFPLWQKWNRKNIKNYFQVYLKVSLKTLIKRDKKRLYKMAIKGSKKNVVGVDIKFVEPLNSDLIIENEGNKKSLSKLVNKIIKKTKII